MPKVSVIVPIYNVEKYLDRCLNSLLNQTLQDIEIILVDDGSPDNCPSLCDAYALKDSRIKVIHKENAGLGFARNSGLEIATGDFVAFVDSDDYVDVNMYQKLYKTALDNSLDTVYCGLNNVDAELNIIPISEVSEFTLFDTPEKIQQVLLDMIATEPSSKVERKYRMSVWHAIYSRKIIVKNNIKFWSEREYLSEDIIFDIDYLSNATRIAIIPDSFYYYCFNEDSLTKSFRADRLEKQKKLYEAILVRLNELGYDSSIYKDRIDKFFIGYIKFNLGNIARSNIGYPKKYKLVKEICSDPIWERLASYPIKEVPLKQQLILLLIRTKQARSILALYKLFRG
ncbi:glycosyltransferase [Maribacter sp. PR1]|uniref:Glycosyltransferase n=1 Tax=Maribacter cobaltidurans TaxID=1178778 RepID=A0ABU7IWA0_9FLAO|nr:MULTISPECIES: glycosyltransferase [Maribacter]MDC6389770.1 glycosyltransferase [Maribacter sp. PR1]MEE1977160.1 glycosyltransferase [Maribacter cobaltidurans]